MTKNWRETYQGRPCKNGHAGIRYKINRSCVECQKILALKKANKKRISDTEGYKARNRAYAKTESGRAQQKRSRERHAEKIKEYRKKYYLKNAEKIKARLAKNYVLKKKLNQTTKGDE